eukprot:937039-Rhodomonas_salina.3
MLRKEPLTLRMTTIGSPRRSGSPRHCHPPFRLLGGCSHHAGNFLCTTRTATIPVLASQIIGTMYPDTRVGIPTRVHKCKSG